MTQTKKFEKGTVIFREGQWEICCYDIISGKVAIYSNYGEEGETLLTELGPGKFFGEMAIIEFMPRSATAIALEDTEVSVINNASLDYFLVNDPDKITMIIKNLTNRLRELSAEYVETCRLITEYVSNDESMMPQKKGLLEKIKKLTLYIDKYNEAYVQLINENPELTINDRFIWY